MSALLICRLHFWTGLRRAKFGDGAVKEIDLIVEVHDYNCGICLAGPDTDFTLASPVLTVDR